MTPNRSAALREYLAQHYPCQQIPRGVSGELARRFGVTPQMVSTIIRRLNLKIINPTKPTYLCICGRKMRTPGTICVKCCWVTLPCENCGEPVRRRASDLVWHNGKTTNLGQYTGRVFCNRHCLGSWFGRNHGWGAYLRRRKEASPSESA